MTTVTESPIQGFSWTVDAASTAAAKQLTPEQWEANRQAIMDKVQDQMSYLIDSLPGPDKYEQARITTELRMWNDTYARLDNLSVGDPLPTLS